MIIEVSHGAPGEAGIRTETYNFSTQPLHHTVRHVGAFSHVILGLSV